MKRLRLPFALFVFTLAASLPAADKGAADPKGLPRPAGLERTAYSPPDSSSNSETAKYHSASDFDTVKAAYAKAFAAEGWRQTYDSDFSSGPTRVAISDWELGNREAEVRIYGRKDPGTDVWVRGNTTKNAAVLTPAAPATPAKTVAPAGAGAAPATRAEQGPASDPNLVAVPDLAGKTASDAEALLRSSNLVASWSPGKPKLDQTAVPTTVSGQDPAPGKRVARGSTVTLIALSGPVPSVVGRWYNEAKQTLTGRDPRNSSPLRFVVQKAPTTLPSTNPNDQDKVVAQDPAAGTTAMAGSTVTLTLLALSGPVPNVVGNWYPGAKQILTGTVPMRHSDLKFVVQKAPTTLPSTNPNDQDKVVAQDPAAGTTAMAGSTVTLTLLALSGPVPNVVGNWYPEAKQILMGQMPKRQSDLKFVVQKAPTVVATSNPNDQDKVVAQDPAAGTTAMAGSTVTLTLLALSGPVPNVVGRWYNEAKQTLTGRDPRNSSALKFVVQKAPTTVPCLNANDDDKVAAQSPAAGTTAMAGSMVTLTLYKAKP